jgi:hypothetical protein
MLQKKLIARITHLLKPSGRQGLSLRRVFKQSKKAAYLVDVLLSLSHYPWSRLTTPRKIFNSKNYSDT